MFLNKIDVGARIKEVRLESGFTLVQWAEKLDTSKSTISRCEVGAGLPDVEFIVKLWLHHEVDPIRLLTGDYDTTDTNKKDGEHGISLSQDEKALIKSVRAATPEIRLAIKTVLALSEKIKKRCVKPQN